MFLLSHHLLEMALLLPRMRRVKAKLVLRLHLHLLRKYKHKFLECCKC
jgi:hypothetical protein